MPVMAWMWGFGVDVRSAAKSSSSSLESSESASNSCLSTNNWFFVSSTCPAGTGGPKEVDLDLDGAGLGGGLLASCSLDVEDALVEGAGVPVGHWGA